MSENPYSAPESASYQPDGSSADASLVEPLVRVSGWMMLLGVAMIIYAVFGLLVGIGMLFVGSVGILASVVYFVLAGVSLTMGVRMCEASSRLKSHHLDSPHTLRAGVTKLASVIRLQGILVLVAVVFIVIGLVLAGVGAVISSLR